MLDEFERDEGLRHFQRGVALERVNRITEAIEEYRLAVASYPPLSEAHAALGFYYQRIGLLAKAADEFYTVTNLEGDFLGYFNLGCVLVDLDRFDEALDALQQCLRLQPDDIATHYQVGFVHFCRGEFQEAVDHLSIPLQHLADDWRVHSLLGKCYLGLGHHDEAMTAFGKALMLADVSQVRSQLLDQIDTVERHREFRALNSAKDEMYAQEGVVYLGSAQDNGLVVTEVRDYHFTYPDIGTTLQRLLALQQSCRWPLTAVVSLDRLSQPLAIALSELLEVPLLHQVTELSSRDHALLVMAVAREAELLLLAMQRTPCTTMTFCLGLNWLRHSRILPDLIGIAARGACSVPWEATLRRLRADGAPLTHIDACIQQAADQTLHAVRETPPDKNLARQIRYYTRKHRRLSFASV